jgi:uncharacterized membrane protein YhaH (DUF805 family)
MGGVSIWHWIVVIAVFACIAWYISATVRLLRAAGRSPLLAAVVLIPWIGPAFVQSLLAKSLAP